ncbi:MAG: ribosomal RNA small subunit methyltransferase A [Planctomycetes bacterium]|nr:ribosomal RNA small subunit methyltransferase A [Planctomycetota bacterium]
MCAESSTRQRTARVLARLSAVTGNSRDSFARYREELDAMGFRPSSARGQNFLLDPTLHRYIAEAAAKSPEDVVLEIGVGLGFLTRELAVRSRRVIGVEIDDRLFEIAGRDLADHNNVRLICADALGGPSRTLHPAVMAMVAEELQAGGAFVVAANLPYSISGPLLAELVCQAQLPARAVLLVQKELGDRIAAREGSVDYGSLSALVQSVFTVRALRIVPPEVFRPRPKVASLILLLELRADLPLPLAAARQAYARFLRRLFQQRRKTMRTTLPAAAAAVGLAAPKGFSAEFLQQRAEVLSVSQVLALWQQIAVEERADR